MQKDNKFSRTNLRQLWINGRWALAFSWHTAKHLLILLVLVIISLSLVPAGLALTVRGLVDAIAAGADSADLTAVWFWLIAGFIVTLVDVLAGFAHTYLIQRFRDELTLRINYDILVHAAKLDVAQFEDPQFQDVLARVQQDIAARFSLFMTKLLAVLNQGLQIIWLTLILVAIEPWIIVIMLAVAAPYLLLQWQLAKYQYTEEFFRITKIRWTRYFVEHLTRQEWVPEAKLLNLGPLFAQKFRDLMAEFRDKNRRIYGRTLLGNSLFAAVSSIAFFLTLGRVAIRTLQGELGLGDLAIYGGATARLRNSLEQAISNFTSALEQTLHIANLREFFAIEPQISQHGNHVPDQSYGRIQLENVTFAYPGAAKPVLQQISLEIAPGETVAIVGRNGAGKTTLVKLLARLYEPSNGRILFDGRPMDELAQDYLRQQIAFVFQHYGRYEATAAENIAYGDWPRLLDNPAAIQQVAEMAGVDDLIREMPNGYDTMLGRWFGEYTLSGGQWQNLAIARAFARPASLIILDEPTSNLDAMSEFQLYSRFRELATGRTAILISHRFSTVSMADRILVLDNGVIIESGKHNDLLERGGLYAQMYAIHRQNMYGTDIATTT